MYSDLTKQAEKFLLEVVHQYVVEFKDLNFTMNYIQKYFSINKQYDKGNITIEQCLKQKWYNRIYYFFKILDYKQKHKLACSTLEAETFHRLRNRVPNSFAHTTYSFGIGLGLLGIM